jgi:hypothetical protein
MRSNSRSILLTCALVALLFVPDARAGIVLPPADFSGHLRGNGYDQTFDSAFPGNFSFGHSDAALGVDPSPSAEAFVTAAGFSDSAADGTITYSFAVIGPADGISVPLNVATFVSFDVEGVSLGTPASFFLVQAYVQVARPGFISTSQVFSEVGFLSDSVSKNLNFPALTGTVNTVTVFATAEVNNSQVAPANSSADAFADPVITFASGFDSTGYRIIFSQGIGNSPFAVPAPSSLAMSSIMLGIFSAMSWYGWFKRSKAALPA